ncbi:nicotinate-nucleotide--dimethylbenzimidazole phosphoribosyltransferase [Thalassococcus lentus]|uniref:Nicotinate-nucleotide--dimethylbenzimidazole phosphoribosyltransferase n=1 Tax=Thalassococcus lentus TaxID=1210524 RepID=A0ABT4XQD5_9RHOB|nr:nicotinate-nucleotide--dimethylbenzimidazole phosphoribosyltransferase [Thalassococcus lentus]MDA7424112.1 nicotinate-nucleotide--dimethylbenzimidazole phosphoribosyltransferase [Thalassococcus lentus]
MSDFEDALKRKIDSKTKPVGSLGRIEALAMRTARLQRKLDPEMERACLVIFAGDHGIADEGVSAYPAEVTRQMVLNFAGGGAAANVFARAGDLDLHVVNAGVRGGSFDLPQITEQSLGSGTVSFLKAPAMSAPQVVDALERGISIGSAGDYHAMAFGEMGIGNTASASMLVHRLTKAPLKDVVGRGTGLNSAGLLNKVEILEKASARVSGTLSPTAALSEFGGFEIAMMAGAMIGAAQAKRMVLVDGFIASTAAMIAGQIEPSCRDAMIFCTLSTEPGHRLVLDAVGAKPLLDLGLRLGEGTGAALAWPLLRSAVRMLNEMASFEEAGVSGKSDLS